MLLFTSLFALGVGGSPPAPAPTEWNYDFTAAQDTFLDGHNGAWISSFTDDRALSWDEAGSVADVEVLARMATNENVAGSRVRLVVRGSGESSTKNAYITDITGFSSGFNTSKIVSNTYTALASTTNRLVKHNANQWRYVRLRVVGTSIKTKIWQAHLTEPVDWTHEVTDSDIEGAGWVGFAGRRDVTFVDFMSIDTAGGTAPMPGVTPGAGQKATDFTEFTTGTSPTGLTGRWGVASSSFGVLESTAWLVPNTFHGIWDASIKVARGVDGYNTNQSATSRAAVVHTITPTLTDCKIYARFKFSTTTNIQMRLFVRVQEPGVTGEDSYHLDFFTGVARLRKYVAGTSTDLTGTFGGTMTINTWYWSVLEAVGTSIRAKIWTGELGDEPGAWAVEVTDASHASGYAGIGRLSAGGNTDISDIRISNLA